METNVSLVINILLLVGVIVAISRLMKSKSRNAYEDNHQPSLGDATKEKDDIISVRKVDMAQTDEEPQVQSWQAPSDREKEKEELSAKGDADSSDRLMLILVAKENRRFAGYELLQTILTAGLRYGEGQLFHRHQFANGQGPVLCSLAAATASGKFDMQAMGSFSTRGLCLFMQVSHNPGIDNERFSIMIDTAKQLSESLDCYLLDEQRKPLTDQRIEVYQRQLNNNG